MIDTDSVLMRSPLFRDLNSYERSELLERLDQDHHATGAAVISEGDSQRSVWLILQGHCEVVKSRPEREPHRLAELEVGAVFGEMSFFSPAPHSATVRALSELKTLRLRREQYDSLRGGCTSAAEKIAANIAIVIADRLRKMDEWTCGLVEQPDTIRHRDEWQNFRAKLYTDWDF